MRLTGSRFILAALVLGSNFIVAILGVSLIRYDLLKREEFLELDWDVTKFYHSRYEHLDGQNVTYDDHLFRALRAYRHTTVLNHFDYKYTSLHLMEQAQGAKANAKLCQRQLKTLVNMAKKVINSPVSYGKHGAGGVPLSAINFLESNGRAESGVLNGNYRWLGHYHTCIRAKIPANSSQQFWQEAGGQASDIVGRYCVAHLKSRSWPKRDIYFDDRISVKVATCLPDTCHSLAYSQNKAIQQGVDYLARFNLVAPFNGDRYYIDSLYCLPEEDSPIRQWDMGAKLFVAFVIFWAALLIYANRKYGQRNQREDLIFKLNDEIPNLNTNGNTRNGSVEKPVASTGDRINNRRQVNGDVAPKKSSESTASGFDLARAFSIESNLGYLLKTTRANEYVAKEAEISPQRLNRLSSSYQDLKEQSPHEQEHTDVGTKKGVADSSGSKIHQQSRVNLDLFDGIKAFATVYILLGHTTMVFFGIITDMKFADERMLDTFMIAMINTLHVVGLFYIITGALITYLVFSRCKPKQLVQPTFWILVVVGRYIRLFPSYFLVFWFAKHVAPYTGSGAHWFDYRTDAEHPRSVCGNESWLTMITMSAADIKIPMDCVPQAWYLSNDFRTLLIIPFYIVLLVLSKKAGYAAIFATFGLSFMKLVKILRNANIDYMVLLHWQPHVLALMNDRLHDTYTDLTVRLSTYLLGVIVGHLLYLYETRQIRSWPKWLTSIGFKVALTMGAITYMGIPLMANPYINQFLPKPKDIDSDMIVVIIPILKSAMELWMSIVLLLVATGSGFRWLNELLSCRIAKVLASISYIVFLIHIELMYKFPILKLETSYWYLFLFANFFIVVSNILAFLIYVLYEMPITNLTRSITKKVFNKIVKQ